MSKLTFHITIHGAKIEDSIERLESRIREAVIDHLVLDMSEDGATVLVIGGVSNEPREDELS